MNGRLVTAAYEIVLSTDEAYYTVVFVQSEEEANRIVAQGNETLWDDGSAKFEVKPREVLKGTQDPWTAEDFKDCLADHIYDFADYFKTTPEDD